MPDTPVFDESRFANRIFQRFETLERKAARWAERSAVHVSVYEFVRFGCKQAWACLFGGAMLALLLLTHFAYPEEVWLARYDFLFIAALAIQVLMLWAGFETWQEAKVIFIFHLVGTAMEIFKTLATPLT